MAKKRQPPPALVTPVGIGMTLLPLYCHTCRHSYQVILRGCVHRVKGRLWWIRDNAIRELPEQRCPECDGTDVWLVGWC